MRKMIRKTSVFCFVLNVMGKSLLCCDGPTFVLFQRVFMMTWITTSVSITVSQVAVSLKSYSFLFYYIWIYIILF